MRYEGYLKDLNRIHTSEIYGAAVFRAAASVTLNKTMRAKWKLLYELEVQTLKRFHTYMAETNQKILFTWGWSLRGHAEGIVLGLLPWEIAMRMLADGTESYQQTFARLKKHSVPEDEGFFDYVYAHEKAIEAFALKELSFEKESTLVLNALLNNEGVSD